MELLQQLLLVAVVAAVAAGIALYLRSLGSNRLEVVVPVRVREDRHLPFTHPALPLHRLQMRESLWTSRRCTLARATLPS